MSLCRKCEPGFTEWLASPGGASFSKPIESMSKQELNACLKCFYPSARKKHGTYYKSSSTKSIRSFFKLEENLANPKVENLIKQLFRSCFLDMRLVLTNSALRASFSYPTRAHGIIVLTIFIALASFLRSRYSRNAPLVRRAFRDAPNNGYEGD